MTIERSDIRTTYARIAPHLRRTPVLELSGRELGLGPFRLSLKEEMQQHAGSFKARGAFANLLLREIPPAGVAAASGGNHGAAVAYAAQMLGVPARIFVPEISSPAKVARIRACGAHVEVGGARYEHALARCREWVRETGALDVHAFDQRETLLGQGTLGLELAEQCARIDTVIAAVGGGGLAGGLCAWFHSDVRVIGVEPVGAPTLTRALAAGEPVDAPAGSIAADSLAPARIGRLAFPILREHLASCVLVEDDDIQRALRVLWNVCRVVVEPGAAAPAAALLSQAYVPAEDEHVVVVLSGANTTAVSL